ncbi:hypothetical protein Tco_0496753 [Tanacetum coccineum]
MRRLTKGYTGVEIRLFPTMLTSPTPSSSLTRIASSPSLSSTPSIEPTFEPQPSPDAEYHVPSPNESPLHAVYSHGSDEDSLKLIELMNLVTKFSERIGVLEDDLKKTKQTYIDDDVVHDTAEERQPEDSTAGIEISNAPINDNTSSESLSTAGKETRKYKGKAIMTEPEPEKKSKKLLEQEILGLEEAISLQEQVDEEEIVQIARKLLALDEERATSEPKTTKDIDWNDPSNQSNYKMKDFEGMSYDEIRPIFKKGDLHTLFKPDEESEIWMNQNEYNLISWSLCDFCGVHILLMQNGIAIHMLTEKKYPLSQEMISKMLSKRLEVDQESTQAYELLKFIRSQVNIAKRKVNTADV